MDEAAFFGIVDSIYDAAVSYALWPETLGRLGEMFGCCTVSLVDRDLRTMTGRAAAWGVDDDGQREFFDVWGKRNVFVHRTRVWRPGQIETDRDILPKDELIASDYYNGFFKPRGMHSILRVTLNAGTNGSGNNQALTLVRSRLAGDYERADVERCRHFVPHLQRAGRVAMHLEKAQVMLDGVTDVLERSNAGVLLLDCVGRIVFANRAALAMAQAADGFVLRRERIEALDCRDDTALQSLIARATGGPVMTEARGGAIALARKSGKPAFNAVVAPLAGRTALRETDPVAFAVITDPEAGPENPQTMLAQLFGFSPAEIRVAERLMAGDSPEEAATALNIKISTARWHLAALYRKTDTSRQAELVRLLLSLPATRLS